MKKNLIYVAMSLLVMLMIASCDDNSTEGVTRITEYPILTLEGDATVIVDKGTAYEEPGYSAIHGDEDVTSQVVVKSNVDVDKSGSYTITYTITNADGLSASASRKVVVLDPNDPVEGLYYTSPESYCNTSGSIAYLGGSYPVLITRVSDDTYLVDDFLGGFFCYLAGYGSDYEMFGDISVADDGTLTLHGSYMMAMGSSLSGLTNGKFDAPTGTISWDAEFMGRIFHIIMTK